jgi:hypothetical protein
VNANGRRLQLYVDESTAARMNFDRILCSTPFAHGLSSKKHPKEFGVECTCSLYDKAKNEV